MPQLAAALLLVLATAAVVDPPGLKPLAIGTKAPDFTLPGVDGKTYTLAEFQGSKLLVIVFTCNHCPTAQAYEQRLIDFTNAYKGKGVAVVAINPNDNAALRLDELGYTDLDDSFEAMKTRAGERQFPFPYLDDGATQKTALAYGALATPHVFVFDADRVLRYQGRFDNGEVKGITSHDTIDAVEALLAGGEVKTPQTRPFGCSTKWADKRHTVDESFAKWNVEPVTITPIEAGAVKTLAANATDKLLVVNLWATWCGPCVEEMPSLVEIHRMYRGRKFQVVTISLDEPDQTANALKLLESKHASTTNYHFIGDRDRLAEALDPEWPGPIPYTVVIAPGGKVLKRFPSAFEAQDLKRTIADALGRTYASR
jgi:thiol-disulfide isomerase/thioredoxin